MPRNIEIKARIDGTLNELIEKITPFSDGPPIQFRQCDTFFNCPSGGRIKLRVQDNIDPHLIYYERNDSFEAKLSNYSIVPVINPNELKNILSLSLGGIRGELNKHRTLFLTENGQIRIHLDQIESLSSNIFIELEIILNDNQTIEDGQIIANELSNKIGIIPSNHIHCAYIDLLLEK